MTDNDDERAVVLRGGPIDGQTQFYTGTIMRVFEPPSVKILPEYDCPKSARDVVPRTGEYQCVNIQEPGGYWRFEWKGWIR
ncbi:hypothetical protein [Sphingomonas sp. TREG-RG-20F-R18-01]|uniref:hypothetical protein n=1 Tax=Sphingomonas sp. TREG-RG-20F-R18-01 TaxID=2914982 RepID=UPI001F56138E|nr:hypothetical protein [Sphingomonas sp. TREG-RG-20F-R18-01]